MFDYGTFKLMHSHGKDLFSMEETSHHDAAQHDPERGWSQGGEDLPLHSLRRRDRRVATRR